MLIRQPDTVPLCHKDAPSTRLHDCTTRLHDCTSTHLHYPSARLHVYTLALPVYPSARLHDCTSTHLHYPSARLHDCGYVCMLQVCCWSPTSLTRLPSLCLPIFSRQFLFRQLCSCVFFCVIVVCVLRCVVGIEKPFV